MCERKRDNNSCQPYAHKYSMRTKMVKSANLSQTTCTQFEVGSSTIFLKSLIQPETSLLLKTCQIKVLHLFKVV